MERLPKEEPVVPPSTFVAPSREELMKDVQGVIVQALEARTEYIRQEADTVTLAKLRRILEKDLKVESGFLETYKVFVAGHIKELLQSQEHGPEAGNVIDESSKGKEKVIVEPKAESKRIEESLKPRMKREKEIEEPEAKSEGIEENLKPRMKQEKVIEEPEAESEVIEEDLKPRMKRLKKKADSAEVKDEVMLPVGVAKAEEEVERDIEGKIWDAAQKRASQFKTEAETLTVNKVRRLLEQDLEFENGALDAFKDHIRAVLDEILNSENLEDAESPENEVPEAPVTKTKKRKEAEPESTKKRKRASGKEVSKSDTMKGEETPKVRKGKKSKKKIGDEEDGAASGDGDGEPSEKGSSSIDEADDEVPERKKSKPVESKPVYSRKVEHLKSIIKDCGITLPVSVINKAKRAGVARRDSIILLKVPPSVYKKAKQAGESRREGIMIMELEAILAKEGLTASASRDEIKAVRKRKEKLKDLEGIDTSNIIEETRGRRSRTSANSFFAPQRNDPIELGDGDEDDDDDEDEDEDEDEDDNSEGDPNVEPQDDEDDED